ncbi:TPMT family class I SAM-dependent methyltransferase [Sinomicrobium kalidii]|uniref:methyltransferase domain-containing protein n=1 Tax=Sinomicrobium kalidii TaxID=2900738 RepID=UPI001E2900D9|nr:methyltransferase domain-containing protein [Sinomicrobium kalidii]UGU15048.1 TPMT family class I SAM-dependent methyltransferase [Sinomicrobium kalidii]
MQNGTKQFWEEKYKSRDTFWDIGHISTPLKAYIDQLEDKNIKILIPGAGNGYEAEYLLHQGFKNVHVLDFALPPLQNFKKRVPGFPEKQLLNQDFFTLDMTFDLILEQTFFCALPPQSRPDYARKMQQLLNPEGKLAGLLFDFPLTEEGPPFGGDREEYFGYFSPYFDIVIMERCYNSIKPREGREFFFILKPKSQNNP